MKAIMKAVWTLVKVAMGYVASAFKALFSYASGGDGFFATVKSWLGSMASRVRTSFVALVSSKSVWASVIVIGLACYCGGFMLANAGKRSLRADRDALSLALQSARLSKAAASGREREASEALAKAQDEIKRLEGQLSAKSAAVAAKPKRRATSPAPAPKPASAGFSMPAWSPWN